MQSSKTFFDYILKMAFVAGIGCVLGHGVAWLAGRGYFQTWQGLPSPPVPAAELVVADLSGLFVRAAAGTTYQLRFSTAGWVQADVPQNERTQVVNVKPCERSSPAFFFLAGVPPNLIDCLQTTLPGADSASYKTYALQQGGKLWIWQHTLSTYSAIGLLILLAAFGALVGMLVGIVWAEPLGETQRTLQRIVHCQLLIARSIEWLSN
jgi:hypothetical protein